MAVAPLAQRAQLLHLGVVVLHVVLDGQAGGIEDADVAAEAEENARALEGQQARVGASAHATEQHHHLHPVAARPLEIRMRHLQRGAQLELGHPVAAGHIAVVEERAVLRADRAVVLVFGDRQRPRSIRRIRPGCSRRGADVGVVQVWLGRHGGGGRGAPDGGCS